MMHVQFPRRTIARAVPVLWVVALLAACCTGTALAAASSSTSGVASQSKLGGKWKGHYGGAVSGKFTIHWTQTGSTLNGRITLSNPQGSYAIGGSVHKGKIKFGAVGVGAKYKGTVKGTSMSGTWTSPEGGGSWSANKVKAP